ncbi:GNAT family N-acetyltransferase [Pseudomonas abieticivorans]|uniref:GNAT family N-acetyltransferase n=1 Tax=Pseudomonas abieticivorans TaxID=2931382 RepID=UPI0032DE57EF
MLRYYSEFDLRWEEEGFNQAWVWRDNRLIEVDGVRQGYVSLSLDSRALFIRELHLNECVRGKGVGSWVIDQVVALARQRRLPLVRLTVFASNPARYLYLRKGFEQVGIDECFLRMECKV